MNALVRVEILLAMTRQAEWTITSMGIIASTNRQGRKDPVERARPRKYPPCRTQVIECPPRGTYACKGYMVHFLKREGAHAKVWHAYTREERERGACIARRE